MSTFRDSLPGDEARARYDAAIAAELARAPRQLSPSDAAAIGVLLGPLRTGDQEHAQGSAA